MSYYKEMFKFARSQLLVIEILEWAALPFATNERRNIVTISVGAKAKPRVDTL